jgi:hypothetical protein
MDSCKDTFSTKSDYTKKALRELNEQMKTFDYKSVVKRTRDSSDEELDFEQTIERHKRADRRQKVSDNTEIALMNKIRKLEMSVDKLSVELDTTDIVLYNTKLELSNKIIELEDETEKTKAMAITIKDLRRRDMIKTIRETLLLMVFIFYVYYFW